MHIEFCVREHIDVGAAESLQWLSDAAGSDVGVAPCVQNSLFIRGKEYQKRREEINLRRRVCRVSIKSVVLKLLSMLSAGSICSIA